MTDPIGTNQTAQSPSSFNNQKSGGFGNKFIVVLRLFFCVLIFCLLVFVLNYFNILSISAHLPKLFGFLPTRTYNTTTSQSIRQTNGLPENALEKVGQEYIYPDALNTELSNYPDLKNIDTKKLLLEKIAHDSIILQAGQKEGLIQLDRSDFNSPQLNYLKRIALVSHVEGMIENRQNSIKGSVVSLWFYNDKPGNVGYEKGKQIAFSTISALYNQVKNKTMTIQQAADAIKNNTSLAQVDSSYKTNALFAFNAGQNETISFDPTFDALIRKLEPGQLTPVYLAQDKDLSTGQMIDAVYMFATVTDKETDGNTESFNQWFAKEQNAYEITLY